MDNLDDDYSLEPEDEARYLNLFTWERHLSQRDRWRLFITRARLEAEHETHFALKLGAVLGGEDFAGELTDAGEGPRQRALVRLEAELSTYW